MKYQITLKNIKHAEFASEETHCFEATVYVNGKRSFTVQNDGKGGCNNYHAVKGQNNHREVSELVHAIDAELELDVTIGDLVNDFLEDRNVKKLLKKILYTKSATSGVYSITAKIKPTPENIARIKAGSWWNPEYTIINELPFAEVRTLLSA